MLIEFRARITARSARSRFSRWKPVVSAFLAIQWPGPSGLLRKDTAGRRLTAPSERQEQCAVRFGVHEGSGYPFTTLVVSRRGIPAIHLPGATRNEPSLFEVEIVIEGVRYRYGFRLTARSFSKNGCSPGQMERSKHGSPVTEKNSSTAST